MNLVVDFYNAYKKIASLEENVVFHFFKFIYLLQRKFKCGKVYFAIDGTNYLKSKMDPDYKKVKKGGDKERESQVIQSHILHIPNYNIIKNNRLEADDVAYCFCRDNDHCICISEDRDWLYNLTANDDIRVYRGKHVITKYNFQPIHGYPVEKIGLGMFLQGDAKDGVKKPFRIKGKLLENINQYSSINNYITDRDLDKSTMIKYAKLILPITRFSYLIKKGRKTTKTLKFLRKYRLNFLKSSSLQLELA